jgi:cyclopropane fatty-acyl-phospholipid synthase-like methyltransferase
VLEFISTTSPGSALDLGCGSGTSSLGLAQAGWAVWGVDFVARAVRRAQVRARRAGLSVQFLVADVSRLPAELFARRYDLVLDIGCFHGLEAPDQQRYLSNLPKLLAPGGSWLIYGFFSPRQGPAPDLRLVSRRDSLDRGRRPSAWFQFQAGPPLPRQGT